MKSLKIGMMPRDEEQKMFNAIMEALKAANSDHPMMSSNFALAVFVQGAILLRAFGVDKEWFHAVIDNGFDDIMVMPPLPKVEEEPEQQASWATRLQHILGRKGEE